jgi:hypothetical protein
MKIEFAGQRDPLNHRFLDLSQVAFWVDLEEENEFEGQATP